MSPPPYSCPGTASALSPSPWAAAGPPGRQSPTAQTPRSDAPRAPRLSSPTARCPLRAGRRHRAPSSTCSRMPTAARTARPRPGPAPSMEQAAPSAVRLPLAPARSDSRVPPRPLTSWAVSALPVSAPWPKGPRPSFPSAGPRLAPRPQPTMRRLPLGAPCWALASAPSPHLCARKVNQGAELGGWEWRKVRDQLRPPPPPRHILMGNLSPDDLTLRRRSPKAWNESDLDVAYEKKSSQTASYEREWCEAKGVGDPERPPQTLMIPASQDPMSSRGLLHQACSCYPGERAAWMGWGPPGR